MASDTPKAKPSESWLGGFCRSGRWVVVASSLFCLSSCGHILASRDFYSPSWRVPSAPGISAAIPNEISEGEGSRFDLGERNCGLLGGRITLSQAAEAAICNNPKLVEAWYDAASQAASLGNANTAYLPSATLNVSDSEGTLSDNHSRVKLLSHTLRSVYRNAHFSLTWLILDGGERSATVASAKDQLLASLATHNVAILETLVSTAQAYFDACAAVALVKEREAAEDIARQSMKVAQGRYQGGASSSSDFLQSETVYTQARFATTQAREQEQSRIAQLAIELGVRADVEISVDQKELEWRGAMSLEDVNALIAEAERTHPSIQAAEEKYKASLEQVRVAKSEGAPTLSFTMNGVRTTTVGQPGGAIDPEDINQAVVGLQLNIPIGVGIDRAYSVAGATAKANIAKEEVRLAKEQLSLQIWTNYKGLEADVDELNEGKELVQIAERSYQVAGGRYKSGVGTILELLNAQNALAAAREQLILTTATALADRVKLASSLGRLELSSINQ